MGVIRTLRADEIECRVAQVKQTRNGVGCSLLLYKDARCDMSILDEVYGATNWMREHVIIDGRLYCNLSVWDAEKSLWVTKQDVGTESNTEKEKGQASDSFKRAGTNWGIGRELYTAPFIWIALADGEYTSQGERVRCNQTFKVSEISYSDSRKISGLVIVDKKGNERYRFGSEAKPKEEPKIAAATAKANDVKKLLVKISGDKTIAQQVWNEQYKQDAGDIVKMNEALIELQDKLKKIEAMRDDA